MLVTGLLSSGCYYGHLATGQLRVLMGRRSLDAALDDAATPKELRERLALVRDVRAFAVELGLSVEGRYTSYLDWPGDRIVTTVVATRPGEIEPIEFWFPILGAAPYKGFFDRARAEREAQQLRAQSMDTCLLAIPAYSSLGWWDDPVTGPMLRMSPGRLVQTLLHELLHATIFVKDEPDWNEGLASVVGQEASIRFYEARFGADSTAARAERSRVREDRLVDRVLLGFRRRVEALYAGPAPAEGMAIGRETLVSEAQAELSALPLSQRDPATLIARLRWNDACLALRGTYHADAERYLARLRTEGNDLRRFLSAAREASDRADPRSSFLAP